MPSKDLSPPLFGSFPHETISAQKKCRHFQRRCYKCENSSNRWVILIIFLYSQHINMNFYKACLRLGTQEMQNFQKHFFVFRFWEAPLSVVFQQFHLSNNSLLYGNNHTIFFSQLEPRQLCCLRCFWFNIFREITLAGIWGHLKYFFNTSQKALRHNSPTPRLQDKSESKWQKKREKERS